MSATRWAGWAIRGGSSSIGSGNVDSGGIGSIGSIGIKEGCAAEHEKNNQYRV